VNHILEPIVQVNGHDKQCIQGMIDLGHAFKDFKPRLQWKTFAIPDCLQHMVQIQRCFFVKDFSVLRRQRLCRHSPVATVMTLPGSQFPKTQFWVF